MQLRFNRWGFTPDRRGRLTHQRVESSIVSDDFRTSFLLAVKTVLDAEGLRLRECARRGCPRLFVKRKIGGYCTRQCSRLERERRFRERHGVEDLRKRRHKQYVKKIRDKRGAAVAKKVKQRAARQHQKGEAK